MTATSTPQPRRVTVEPDNGGLFLSLSLTSVKELTKMNDNIDSTNAILDCELCIIGAGIGGLNALHSASSYLKATDRVVLVDQHPLPGGMWQDTYEFVRLHQPHPMFTAGNIAWKKRMPAEHLAYRHEVTEQFAHCLNELRHRVDLVTLFEHIYQGHREFDDIVEIDILKPHAQGAVKIRAKRLIKATGYNVKPAPPLSLSSSEIHSTSPTEAVFLGEEMASSNTPILIVGGGKTAMDTAHALCQRFPGREIRMVVGQGVMFFNRDTFFKTGIMRWIGGVVFFEGFLDLALRFNGSNFDQVNQYRLKKYGLALTKAPQQFHVGVISTEELALIRSGLSEVIEDYLDDIVDTPAGPKAILRSGREFDLPAGSWIINCTGLIARQNVEYEPYISDTGRVLSINMTSMPFFLTSYCGYFLTHLMYREALLSTPLYAADMTELVVKGKAAVGCVAESATILNVLLIMKALPVQVFNDCLIDTNRWYPLPRRLPIVLRFMLNNQRFASQCQQALDCFSSNSGISIAPLPHVCRQI